MVALFYLFSFFDWDSLVQERMNMADQDEGQDDYAIKCSTSDVKSCYVQAGRHCRPTASVGAGAVCQVITLYTLALAAKHW